MKIYHPIIFNTCSNPVGVSTRVEKGTLATLCTWATPPATLQRTAFCAEEGDPLVLVGLGLPDFTLKVPHSGTHSVSGTLGCSVIRRRELIRGKTGSQRDAKALARSSVGEGWLP